MGYKKGERIRSPFKEYVIEGKIGGGGSGEVYRVRDTEGTFYAVKILDRTKANSIRLKRFENEVNFCKRATHKNIVQVLGDGVTGQGETFYIMPLFSGTLRDLMLRGIAQDDILPYFVQLLDGMEAAHLHRVWHRDVKPENMLFNADEKLLVVADFGIAHFEEDDLLIAVETQKEERLANFLYHAPEQGHRGQKVDSKADVYSLGLIFNEMFTGVIPKGTDYRKIADVTALYPYLDGLVEQMLRQDPISRPSITNIKQELIFRGNEFVSAQRLNSLKSEVISETSIDDPVVVNPIKIVSTDYEDGQLVFKLSSDPPPNWIMVFRNPTRSFSYYAGSEPVTFSFNGDTARVRLTEGSDASQLRRYALSYVDMANNRYRENVQTEHLKNVAFQREQIRRRIAEEERRRKILASLQSQ